MSLSKPESKIVLLLSPQKMTQDHSVLECLHVLKSAQKTEYITRELTGPEVRNSFPELDKQGKETLQWFSKDGLKFLKDEINKKYASQRAGVPYETYYRNAVTRKLHELFERLKPFAGVLKWYHKIAVDNDRIKTSPCLFSGFKAVPEFEVTSTNGTIGLTTYFNINGFIYPANEFKRYQFLIESRGEYFVLSYKDYQTLEWLREKDPSQYAGDLQAFASNILARLDLDYTVNRNDLFKKNIVEVEPVNRIMLSEISNSFLMLTPQWLYDGLIAEGVWKEHLEANLNGEEYLVKRNKQAETAFITLIESLHPKFSKQLNGYYHLSFAEAQKGQWFAKVYHKILSLDIEVVGMDMLKHFRYSPYPIHTVVNIVKQHEDSVILQMTVSFGDEQVPLTELQKMLQSGQKAVVLKDGSLGLITEEWLQQYSHLIKHGKPGKKEVSVPRWLAFTEEQNDGQSVLRSSIQKTWWQKWMDWQHKDELLYPVPAMVHATLRPYQQKGFEWMAILAEAGAGACLADDMGLGKTLQTICFLSHRISQFPGIKHLIVCPSSLIYNWLQEFARFTPAIKCIVHHGASRNTNWKESKETDVVITSYGTLRTDIELLSELSFGITVLDESHHIKNPAAQITKAVNMLKTDLRIALSGTPVMNNTFDLYAQLNFLLPGLLGSREFFKREYADAIDRNHDQEKIRMLQKITAPFILRRTKEQVARDLPEKNEMIMWCAMSSQQKLLYDSIREEITSSLFLNIKKEGIGKSKLAVLQGILKLRQVCNSPLLLPAQEQTCTDSIKTDLLMDELSNNLNGHKALVFSQFTGMLDLLGEACKKRNIAYYHFDGQTAPAKRAELVNAFQEEGNDVNVFLISLKAGNAGLNLTAADYVFLFDPWWNTAVQQQAIDRTHRIGQTKKVFAYKMVCKDTIEEKIIQLQQRKKQLAEDLISEEEGFVKSLSEEDISYLFS
jgi:SNF2 family DNA or RNA helicase